MGKRVITSEQVLAAAKGGGAKTISEIARTLGILKGRLDGRTATLIRRAAPEVDDLLKVNRQSSTETGKLSPDALPDPDNPYRQGSVYWLIFREASKVFMSKQELTEKVAALTGKSAKCIGYVPPYALRHTFASMCSEGHAETTGLAMLMGHSTTRTLMRYVNNTFSHHLATVNGVGSRIENIVNGTGQDAKSCKLLSPATKLGERVGVAVKEPGL